MEKSQVAGPLWCENKRSGGGAVTIEWDGGTHTGYAIACRAKGRRGQMWSKIWGVGLHRVKWGKGGSEVGGKCVCGGAAASGTEVRHWDGGDRAGQMCSTGMAGGVSSEQGTGQHEGRGAWHISVVPSSYLIWGGVYDAECRQAG